jgi:hypothetical protein
MKLPNILITQSTERYKPIISFGYCEFSPAENQEPVQCPTEQLPDHIQRCFWDIETGTIHVDDTIEIEGMI